MDITVAVCAKNEENTIEDCLKSIQNQSVKPDEIILLDDHSTDSTAKISKKLGVTLIENQGHQLYDARNTALKHCNTEVLAFTDADCILEEHWVENILRVLSTKDVAGGTGSHPPQTSNPIVGWIYKNWLIMETESTGYTGGVAGGNCYFKTELLKEIGGWPSLPYANAEDVYIAIMLKKAGYKLWFDDNIIAYHYFNTDLRGFFRKICKAGEAITVMMKKTKMRNSLWWFTLLIPLVALATILAVVTILMHKVYGLILLSLILLGSFVFTYCVFGSFRLAIPRLLARWIIIWPYGLGIVKGLFRNI